MSATFAAPRTLDEALALRAAGAMPLAGGTDLVVGHRQGRRPLPESLVSLHHVDALRGITEGERVVIGALTTHDALVTDAIVRGRCTGLADAAAIVGSVATRSTGTLGATS